MPPGDETPESGPAAAAKPARWVSILSIACGVAAFVGVRLLPWDLTVRFAAGALVGCLLGLVPYFSFREGDRAFAKQSVVYCALGGLVGGVVLGIPTAIVVWLIGRRRARRAAPGEPPVVAAAPAAGEEPRPR
jgi:hypothetical protein